jgi:hypothetical protein
MLSSDIEIVEKYLVTREYNEAVTPAWLRIKAALAESTNSSHNTASTPLPACITCAVPNCGMKAGYCGLYKPQ